MVNAGGFITGDFEPKSHCFVVQCRSGCFLRSVFFPSFSCEMWDCFPLLPTPIHPNDGLALALPQPPGTRHAVITRDADVHNFQRKKNTS